MVDASITNALGSSDRDRLFAAQFVPSDRRASILAVLAFNSDLGSIAWQVTEPIIGQMRFQWWRDALDGICAGTPPVHMTAGPLSKAVIAHQIAPSALMALIDAREAMFLADQPATLSDLESLVRAVDGAVFSLFADVLSDGAASDDAYTVAGHIGAAWGLIGVVRALPAWVSARRFMLPSDLCRSANLDKDAVIERGPQPALRACLKPILASARGHLNQARQKLNAVPKSVRPAFLAGVLADGHLATLKQAQFDPFDARVQSQVIRPITLGRLWWAARRDRF